MPNLNADFVVPVEVTVGLDGSVVDVVVTTSTGDERADAIAVAFMKEKRFLPGIDESGQPAQSKVTGTVDVRTKGRSESLTANLQPPASSVETARVRRMKCADFDWEVQRLRTQAASTDLSREIMPFVSARMYMIQKRLAKPDEDRFWQQWPKALDTAIERCKASPDKLYFEDVLLPTLDERLAG